MRFYVENFGCRATQADGAAIEQQLLDRGWLRASARADAELVVLNTCSVTAAADQDARAAVRRIRRVNAASRVLVTGCYAQRAPEEVAALPGVTWVVGNSHKHNIAEIAAGEMLPGFSSEAKSPNSTTNFVPLLSAPVAAYSGAFSESGSGTSSSASAFSSAPIFISNIFAHTELLAAPVMDAAGDRTRPNLKIQDGCNNRCSFCIIPFTRGQSRSMPLERIVAEVNALVGAGYQEVVLSGINLGRWGRDFAGGTRNQLRLPDVLRGILDETAIAKIRISSVEPMDWSDDLIALMASSPRIAKHCHVPMQSGSDTVLRRMHRKYRPWHYRARIEAIRAAMPSAAIGADVMVGFPGETDAEFEQTRQMIEELPFTYLHVFTYSPRPTTPAAEMPQVPVHVARERNRVLRELAVAKGEAFRRGFVGQTLEAITLGGFDGESTEALTDNYLKVRIVGEHRPNQWMSTEIFSSADSVLLAKQAGVRAVEGIIAL